jgi:hypothetical protein
VRPQRLSFLMFLPSFLPVGVDPDECLIGEIHG